MSCNDLVLRQGTGIVVPATATRAHNQGTSNQPTAFTLSLWQTTQLTSPHRSPESIPMVFHIHALSIKYCKISNISCTKFQNSNVSLLGLQLSLFNILKQVLSGEWRCSWSSADRRCSNYIWVINNFIASESATYIRGLMVNLWGGFWHLHWTLLRDQWWRVVASRSPSCSERCCSQTAGQSCRGCRRGRTWRHGLPSAVG